jgi:hypothetical protein
VRKVEVKIISQVVPTVSAEHSYQELGKQGNLAVHQPHLAPAFKGAEIDRRDCEVHINWVRCQILELAKTAEKARLRATCRAHGPKAAGLARPEPCLRRRAIQMTPFAASPAAETVREVPERQRNTAVRMTGMIRNSSISSEPLHLFVVLLSCVPFVFVDVWSLRSVAGPEAIRHQETGSRTPLTRP